MDTKKRVAAAAVLVVLVCVMTGLMVNTAHAQGKKADAGAGGADTSLATKKDLAVFDGDPKKKDDGTGVKYWQMGLGFGSVVVAIAVVKWL